MIDIYTWDKDATDHRAIFVTTEQRQYGFFRITCEEEIIDLPLPKDLLIFDLEATGTNVMEYDLAQIGAVKVCNRCLKYYDEFEIMTRPLASKVDDRAMAIHKIPLETLMKAPELEEALSSFEE